jgi:hypothetical protein
LKQRLYFLTGSVGKCYQNETWEDPLNEVQEIIVDTVYNMGKGSSVGFEDTIDALGNENSNAPPMRCNIAIG